MRIRMIVFGMMILAALSSSAQVGTVTKYISYGSYSNVMGQTVESNVFDFANFPAGGGTNIVSVTNTVTMILTNLINMTNVVQIINNSTNTSIVVVTNLVEVTTNTYTYTTNTYVAVDDSKWPTNQPFACSFVWTNAGDSFSITNAGKIYTTINTNSGSANAITNNGVTINGQSITNGASVTIAAGGGVTTNWIDAACIGVGIETTFPTYQVRTNANGSMPVLAFDKTVSGAWAGPFIIVPASTNITTYWQGYHSTTGTTAVASRWRSGLNAWSDITTSALQNATGSLTNFDTLTNSIARLTALTPIEFEITTISTNSGSSGGFHYLRAFGWTP